MKVTRTSTTGWEPASLIPEKDVSRVIRELSPEHLQEIAAEMRDLKQEAECFGVDQQKMRSGVKLELNTVVSEIYSPPRITRAARMLPRLGITPGFALDLTTNDENGQPWGFDDSRQRNKATHKVLVEKPDLLVGSPMCVEFSAWQRLNKA